MPSEHPRPSQHRTGSARLRLRLRWLSRRGRRYFSVLFGANTSRQRRLRYAAGGAAALAGALLGLLFLYTLLLVPFTPGISELKKAKYERPSVLLSAGGEPLVTLKPLHREWVELEEVSETVRHALIATEDHRFYGHPGVDPVRIFGALWHTLTGDPQGGSTLTQQLARNLYPDAIGRSVSLTRKLKEIITAFKIELTYSKDEILETYLNTVPFLYNAYGIEMAARTYFGTSAADLDVLESATLVGMLKGTYYYNPVRHPERSLQRRNVVLRQMVRRGFLDEQRYEALRTQPLAVDFERQAEPESPAPHFTEHVRRWLVAWADRRGYNIYRDSLVVHTTLDLDLQRAARAAVDRWMPALQAVADVEWSRSGRDLLARSPDAYRTLQRQNRPFAHLWEGRPDLVEAFIRSTPQYRGAVEGGAPEARVLDSLRADADFMEALRQIKTRLEVGLVALNPQSGHVQAWIGSRDYGFDQYDHVARARRQPGSTFKPFVYAAALEEGFSPEDTFPDREVEIPVRGDRVWTPRNADGYSGRDLTLTEGLVYSKNTITAQLIDEVGTGDVARLAQRMGVRRSRLDEVPSLALGTSEVSLLEMAAAYGTLAALGIYREPLLVTHIEDRDGRVVYEAPSRARRVLSEETARAVIDMMRGVVDRGTGRRIRTTFGIRADVAGKTGTTQNNADGWFILMHPELVTGAWVGFNDPRLAFRSDYWGSGGNNALFIVGEFFRRALAGGASELGEARFPPPVEAERGFFARAGRWIGRAAEDVGRWIGEAFSRAAEALFGGEDGPEQAAPEQEALPEGEAVYDQSSEETRGAAEADSLSRLERESTQLNELLERIRAQREQSSGDDAEAENPPDLEAPLPDSDPNDGPPAPSESRNPEPENGESAPPGQG